MTLRAKPQSARCKTQSHTAELQSQNWNRIGATEYSLTFNRASNGRPNLDFIPEHAIVCAGLILPGAESHEPASLQTR